MVPSSRPDESLDFRKQLLKAEGEWDIRPEVAQEWEPTFDRLLQFYNTQDMKTIITRSKPQIDVRNDKLPIKELRKWIKPKFKPPTWKKIFCQSQYRKEEEGAKQEFEELFGGAEEAAKDKRITRAQFIDKIMEELRGGKKDVSSRQNYTLLNSYWCE